jgi:hypothetical protein
LKKTKKQNKTKNAAYPDHFLINIGDKNKQEFPDSPKWFDFTL